MKWSAATALCLLCGGVAAQAQEPVPLAHGNVPGEPHHHLKIENEYVRVYYVEVAPHEDTLLHQHDHDYVYISLGPSDVVNAVVNKPEIHLQLKDGETHFTRGGFAHVARNLADTPFRNITIELLKPQGEAHNRCGKIIPDDEVIPNCDLSVEDHAPVMQFETAEITSHLVLLPPKMKYAGTSPRQASLIVSLTDSGIEVRAGGKSAETLHEGELKWLDDGSKARFSNENSRPSAFLEITFKDPAPNAKP